MFFDNLKSACKEKGTSPTALLRAIGMSTSNVTAWKNGVVPSVGTVYRLAEKLGIDPSTLIDLQPTEETVLSSRREEYSEKERAIIDAYRNKPEFQSAVDVLLGLKGE